MSLTQLWCKIQTVLHLSASCAVDRSFSSAWEADELPDLLASCCQAASLLLPSPCSAHARKCVLKTSLV